MLRCLALIDNVKLFSKFSIVIANCKNANTLKIEFCISINNSYFAKKNKILLQCYIKLFKFNQVILRTRKTYSIVSVIISLIISIFVKNYILNYF